MYAKGGVRTGTGGVIRVQIPYIKSEIPIMILFRALGYEADKDILEHIVYGLDDNEMLELLRPSIEEASPVRTQQVALDFIGKRGQMVGLTKEKRVTYAKDLLQKEMLPHIGIGEMTETRKAYFIGYMIHRMLLVALNRRDEDDRDHYANKRLDLAGPLLASLFRVLFRKMVREVRGYVQRCVDNGKEINWNSAVRGGTISNGLKYSMATGNWGLQGTQNIRPGVAQAVNRLAYASTLSHLRRINCPTGREGKNPKPRHLHNSQWGMICPAETPEGQQCGLVKNLALMAYVSVGTSSKHILELLNEWGMESIEEINCHHVADSTNTKVFVNGMWIGIHEDAVYLVNTLRQLRRSVDVSSEVSVVYDIRLHEIRVYTDQGRVCRPLFIVSDNQLGLKKKHCMWLETGINDQGASYGWNDLVKDGFIEYIDTAEEETTMIAMTVNDLSSQREDRNSKVQNYTHCEIHPAMILGVCASIIPFPDHNQSPRNTYQSAMGKQAMGMYATNYQFRMDSHGYILYYPQKPLVLTRSMEHLHFRELPAGHNAVVAIACYSGYNQEDSMMMNQSSLDRGFFRSMSFRCYKDEEKRQGSFSREEMRKPDKHDTIAMKHGTYDKLDGDGICSPGTRVSGGDVVIGKVSALPDDPGNENQVARFKDSSTCLRNTEYGVVDSVLVTTSGEGQKFVKMKTRSIKIPNVGDKFASRHGQKGTIGITYTQEDMPFSREGISPDLIINPHAIPSRMTIGHMIECLMSKVGACTGSEGDATPFTDVTVQNIAIAMHQNGYQKHGFERLYNGHTGRALQALVFFGPTYYQRLKHMVDDKVHSRARGPMQILTRQPSEGRSRDGGLRFGEMERDCIISHGGAAFLKERLMDQSDAYRIHVCSRTGLIAVANIKKQQFTSQVYQNESEIVQMLVPYACKLLLQELMSIMVTPRMRFE
eukprot:TRINITY_DN6061_c1_g1_i3.p1 TRINITY_DN6061_c1_g1~~TRINITY_DN6061_c1_g1_i3.p1  ORF type:complete len:936 (+),score=118.87 TRINITY_DN6061_c1_g1_i3:123-2930(+)